MTEPLSSKGDGLILYTEDGKGNLYPWVAKPVGRAYLARRLPVYQREQYIEKALPYVGITTDNKTYVYALYEEKKEGSAVWKIDLYRFDIAEKITRTLTLYPGKNVLPLDLSWDGENLLVLYQQETKDGYPLYLQRFTPTCLKKGTPIKIQTEDLTLEGKNHRCSLACYPGTQKAVLLIHTQGLYELRLGDTRVVALSSIEEAFQYAKEETLGVTFLTSVPVLDVHKKGPKLASVLQKEGKTGLLPFVRIYTKTKSGVHSPMDIEILDLPSGHTLRPGLIDHGFDVIYYTYLELCAKVLKLEAALKKR